MNISKLLVRAADAIEKTPLNRKRRAAPVSDDDIWDRFEEYKAPPKKVDPPPTSASVFEKLGWTSEAAAAFWPKLAKHFDLNPTRRYLELGHGQDGYAIDIDNKKVLKITRDSPEAQAMNKLLIKRGDPRYFVRVDDVLALRHEGMPDLYAVKMERLDTAKADWQMFADTISHLTDSLWKPVKGRLTKEASINTTSVKIMAKVLLYAQENGVAVVNADNQEFIDYRKLDNEGSLDPGYMADNNITDYATIHHNPAYEPLKPKLQWLAGLGQEFDRMDITFWDLHRGNIMRRGAHHVMIDLGRSISQPQNIETLEAAYLGL